MFVCNLRPQLPETAGYEDADHLAAVLEHGVPVDAMVVNGAAGGPETLGRGGVRIVTEALARPDGTGHDPQRLAAVLSRLT